MKVTVLGTSGGYAGKNDGCSAYLLSSGGRIFLIDCGPGAVSFLQNFTPVSGLNAILLSHLHPDHLSDLFTLRFALQTAYRSGTIASALPLYLPRTPDSTCRFVLESIGEELTPVFINGGSSLRLGEASVGFLRTAHPLEAYAMRFEEKGSLVYTADTSYFPVLADFARGADMLISEATLQDRDRDRERDIGHMTARTAGRLAAGAGVRKLVLAHLWPPDDHEQSLAQAREAFEGEVLLARRGAVYEV